VLALPGVQLVGAQRNKTAELEKKKRRERLSAIFRITPQLTERLEKATSIPKIVSFFISAT